MNNEPASIRSCGQSISGSSMGISMGISSIAERGVLTMTPSGVLGPIVYRRVSISVEKLKRHKAEMHTRVV